MGPTADAKVVHVVKIVCEAIMTYKTILIQFRVETITISNGLISKIKNSVEKSNKARDLMMPHPSNACPPKSKQTNARKKNVCGQGKHFFSTKSTGKVVSGHWAY